jgi:hypothetical protein
MICRWLHGRLPGGKGEGEGGAEGVGEGGRWWQL